VRELIDTLYSSSWLMTALWIIILFVFVGLALLSPFKNKTLNYFYKGSMYLVAFAALLLPHFFYYGFASSFDKQVVSSSTIILTESYEQGGDGPSENVVRLFVVDKNTGELKHRSYIGAYGKLIAVRNDTVCYLDDKDLHVMNAVTLEELYNIGEKDWGQLKPEFNAGFERIDADNRLDEVLTPHLELACKNGKTYYFDPFSKTVSEKEMEPVYLPGFKNDKDELILRKSDGKEKEYLHTQNNYENKLERIVPDESSAALFHVNDSTGYIEPFLVCIDTIRKAFVFGHYTTTDRKDFILEGKDFNYKALWTKTTKDLGAEGETFSADVWKFVDGTLYINCSGWLIAMDPVSGQIDWRSRL
jgi:hypothetical protein